MQTTSTGFLRQALGFWINFDSVQCPPILPQNHVSINFRQNSILFILKYFLFFSLFSPYICSSFCDVSSLLNYKHFCFLTLSCSFILCLVIPFLCFFNGPFTISALFLLCIALVIGNVLHFWQQQLKKLEISPRSLQVKSASPIYMYLCFVFF